MERGKRTRIEGTTGIVMSGYEMVDCILFKIQGLKVAGYVNIIVWELM
jgi:hypothetical protein